MKQALLATILALASIPATAQTMGPADPYQWLEDVTGEKALAWVRERNSESEAVIKTQPGFDTLRSELLEGLNASDRIPRFTRMGDYVYNLWTDAKNKRGLWRRTTLADYAKPDPVWETVLDLDALGAAETESWVFNSASCLAPAYKLCVLQLSRGGADATVARVRRPGQGLRQKRIYVAGSKDTGGLEGREPPAGGHRFRPRQHDRFGLCTYREAVEARHAFERRQDRVRR